MVFMLDKQELKTGLVIFRRKDVQHSNWYCRMKIPKEDRYKTISLETPNIEEAKEKAFDHDVEFRFKVKHELPVFDKNFSQVAKEFMDFQTERMETGEISKGRWSLLDTQIRVQLNPYVGHLQITLIGETHWKAYPTWRKKNGKGRSGGMVSDGAIRQEMTTFRSVLRFAATKNYIRENQLPRGAIQSDKNRREEFTPQEYRKLHTFGRSWIKEARWDMHSWYRTMAYNFMLVMTNTGMRPPEARNLRWRDVDMLADKHGRKFVTLAVRGKDKFRTLVAPHSVAAYLDRIRSLSKATKSDDYVFTTHKGKSAKALYRSLIQSLLKESELLLSSSGKRRSTYCFRHTYATFRLTEGVDVYFLAKQMGTSVLMIEKHYGHITPVKNADRILQGLPGWEPIADGPGDILGSVNADGAGAKAAKPRTKK